MVLNTTILLLNKPENLSVIADEVITVHQKRAREQAVLTLLRDERSQAQKALDNLMKALEAGIFTATTKDRITELESEIDELNGRILTEECKEANLLTNEDVETFLLDALKAEPQLLIDTLVDKIILFDDKIEIYYKYTQNNNPDDTLRLLAEQNRDSTWHNDEWLFLLTDNLSKADLPLGQHNPYTIVESNFYDIIMRIAVCSLSPSAWIPLPAKSTSYASWKYGKNNYKLLANPRSSML